MEENLAILRLWLTPNVGIKTINALIEHLKQASTAFSLSINELKNIPGVTPSAATAIYNSTEKELDLEVKLMEKQGVKFVSILDHAYPIYLSEIFSPPAVLYYLGNLDYDYTRSAAIVGTRHCTAYGASSTKRIISEIAALDQGYCIISGLALGIDSIAHTQALQSGLKTIAVLGNGLERVYPSQNKELAAEIIASGGAIISEQPMQAPPLAQNFPARNRIISGLAPALMVMEAHEKSGSLITARFAHEQNKEVFALPANISATSFTGSLMLIKNNMAALLTAGEDIVNSLNLKYIRPQAASQERRRSTKEVTSDANSLTELTDATALKIVNLLKISLFDLDQLCSELNLSANTLLPTLTELELSNHIQISQGKYELNPEYKLL